MRGALFLFFRFPDGRKAEKARAKAVDEEVGPVIFCLPLFFLYVSYLRRFFKLFSGRNFGKKRAGNFFAYQPDTRNNQKIRGRSGFCLRFCFHAAQQKRKRPD